MSNVNYSFTTNAEGVLTFQSQVSSFGLDHVTEKDIRSFYAKFSEMAYFDTGLLPVDGSGILSIRSAGPHTQIGYQHAPGMYYINWGGYEGDPNAKKIYVAQPYRIVIADIYNGNLLGARTFYSPIPIQYPAAPLYHVNLPNINCRGYRGNGVGWICLYHREDISHFPFGEKVTKILERCSGVEAYNDANMSETDGPRFYKDHGKPNHIWDPAQWEKRSETDGVEWTLDPDLWIPVLVQDLDNQDKHYNNGEPLTYANAILGNYQAYYTDPIRPKPVNEIVRNSIDSSSIFNWFKVSYNASANINGNTNIVDTFSSTEQVRDSLSKVYIAPPSSHTSDDDEEEDDNENIYVCDSCNDITFNTETDNYYNMYDGSLYCEPCGNDYAVYVNHMDAHFNSEDDDVIFVPYTDNYYYLPAWKYTVACGSCMSKHPYDPSAGYSADMVPIFFNEQTQENLCGFCSATTTCGHCNGSFAVPQFHAEECNIAKKISLDNFKSSYICNACKINKINYVELSTDLNPTSNLYCICGESAAANDFVRMNPILGNSAKVLYDEDKELYQLIVKNNNIIEHFEYIDHDAEKTLENLKLGMFSIYIHFCCPTCHDTYAGNLDGMDIKENLLTLMKKPEVVTAITSNQSENKIAGLSIYHTGVF